MTSHLWKGISADAIDIGKQAGIHIGNQPDIFICCFQGLMTKIFRKDWKRVIKI